MFLLFQMYLSAKEKEEEQRLILEKQRRLEEVLRQKREMEAKRQSDQEMVDDMFDFLTLMPNTVGGQEGQAPMGYEVWNQMFWQVLNDS